MNVERNKIGIYVSQRKYVLDLLSEMGTIGCKPMETPVDPNLKLSTQESGDLVDQGRYQHLVGRLIYLSHTRPDIVVA